MLFDSALKPKLIYVFRINAAAHSGCLKIGEATLPDGSTRTTRGTIEGYIGWEPAGENGFGYDPIFYVDEYGCSTAQLSPEEKNKVSHRGNALRAMREELRSL